MDAAAKHRRVELLGRRKGRLGAQQLVMKNGDDACHAYLLDLRLNLGTTHGGETLPSSVARLKACGAFLPTDPGD